MREKNLQKEYVQGLMQTKYAGKRMRDQLTLGELKEFVQLLQNHPIPTEEDTQDEEIPFE